jgi:hypothetical protein
MNDLVTVATFSYPHQIAILIAKLESEGIECYSKDGMTVQVDPLLSAAVGGIKLQVRQTDEERANEIVEEYYRNINDENTSDVDIEE